MNRFAPQTATPAEPGPADAPMGTAEPPSHQPQCLVGTTQGLVLLAPQPQSAPLMELEGHAITALATGPGGWWAIADHNSVWQRGSDRSWRKIAALNDVELNCLLPVEHTVLVGTAGACLLWLEDGDLDWINCFESVAERDEWYTPWGAPPAVRSLALGPAGDLYVNVHVGGIVRSRDRGQTWQPTIDFHADVHEVCTIADQPDWVLAATAEGLAISENRGRSWHFDRAHLHAPYARAIAVWDETILMSASTGPRTSKAALYRRPLHQPGGFQKCEQGLPEWFASNINTGSLATAADFAAFGTSEGDVFGSRDGGLSWQTLATGLPPIRCLTVL